MSSGSPHSQQRGGYRSYHNNNNRNNNNYHRRGRGGRGRGRGRGRGHYRGGNRNYNHRGGGRGGHRNRYNKNNYNRDRGGYRAHHSSNYRSENHRHHPYKKHYNHKLEYHRIKVEQEINLVYTDYEINKLLEKWNAYTEQQTLTKLISDIPLMNLRNDALHQIRNDAKKNENTQQNKEDSHSNNSNNKNPQSNDQKRYVEGYEMSEKLKLTHLETNIVDKVSVKSLGDLNWKLTQFCLSFLFFVSVLAIHFCYT